MKLVTVGSTSKRHYLRVPLDVLGNNEITIDSVPIYFEYRNQNRSSYKVSLGSVTIIRYRPVASNIIKRQAGFADVEP